MARSRGRPNGAPSVDGATIQGKRAVNRVTTHVLPKRRQIPSTATTAAVAVVDVEDDREKEGRGILRNDFTFWMIVTHVSLG
ncbi:hypothetical protein GCM10009800_53550 [Nocardiopsis rhodophaea]